MKPQCEAVLRLLREQGSAGVTPALALTEVDCMRLAARIAEIAEELPPTMEIVNPGWTTPTGKRVARYVLRAREPEEMILWGGA